MHIILESACSTCVLAPVSQEELFIREHEFIKLSKMEGDKVKMR